MLTNFYLERGSNDNTIQFEISKSDQGKFRPHTWTYDNGLKHFDSNTSVEINKWYFVVMLYDGQYLKLYIDSKLDTSVSLTGNLQELNNPIYFGKRAYFNGNPTDLHNLHGKIDDVRIYNRALTEDEINELYRENGWGNKNILTWEEKAPYNYPRGRPAVVGIDGKIYLVDGGNPTTGSYDYRKLEMYDPNTNTWTEKADMPSGKAGNFGAIATNGKIYVMGGEGPSAGRWSPEVYEYDPTTNNWITKNNWSNPKRDFGFTELNGKIYVAGGQPDYTSYSNQFELYDPESDTWSNLASLPAGMSACPLASVNGKIYLIGGKTSSGLKNWVYEYDPVNNTWLQKASMPEYVCGLLYPFIMTKFT